MTPYLILCILQLIYYIKAQNISTTCIPPETPLPPVAVNITSNSITLNWEYPNSTSVITECVVKDNSVNTLYRGVEKEFTYENLTSDTSYAFRLICENLCKWSSYSNSIIYKTEKQLHYCDINADKVWNEIWYSNNTNLYTIIDEESGECILSHDGQVNPRYQTDELCSSSCSVQESNDYREYIQKTGIKLITTKSSTEIYVISSNQKYSDNTLYPINVRPILNSNDMDNLCFNQSLNNTMGLIWYSQVHWPLGGYDNYKTNLQQYFDNGLRIFLITYGSNSNQEVTERLGSGSSEIGGLTEFGKDVVKELNNIGYIIDCSHCNNQTTVETALLSETPIISNHANVFNISQNIRTFKDDAIKAVIDSGGVIGIMPLKRFVVYNYLNVDATIYDVLEHINYIVVNYGDSFVGVSTDWYMDNIHEYSIHDYIDEYINSWSRWKYIACFLSQSPYNYQYNRIRKIMGGNFQRVYREIFDRNLITTTAATTTNDISSTINDGSSTTNDASSTTDDVSSTSGMTSTTVDIDITTSTGDDNVTEIITSDIIRNDSSTTYYYSHYHYSNIIIFAFLYIFIL